MAETARQESLGEVRASNRGALDLLADAVQLRTLLDRLTPAAFTEPTGFKGWTANDILRHLLRGNEAARLSITDPQALEAMMRGARDLSAEERRAREQAFANHAAGPVLVDAWFDNLARTVDLFLTVDLAERVPWAGVSMSARSLLSARLMEQWAHGQAIYDLVGVDRCETDGIEAVAILGVNTFSFTFRNRGMLLPERAPQVRLAAPSGTEWVFHADNQDDVVSGSAVEFCRVITQVRNIADTGLSVTGAVAQDWMAIAQCFAGPPHLPPAPGERVAAARLRTDLLSEPEGPSAA
ncbi:maleylpyruvate isomerase family mycothiol-dependent enzyme [Sphingomonas soli]|uniref:maleylpyruvate isomerase family mycothiol-dependent enzyme n=1 Tax=Sphingomonas soli TaxID=266127 RepID=UPI0008358A9F|nr:maleylpyruvate isomerase family mycothiol-dependent enzyme [Sphingomonas soli]